MKRTILSVDDEPHMLKLLERFITERTSYEITTTSNSLEVPEYLEKHAYDLILSDLRMPGLDGMEILRMVREQNRFEEVIIITAFGSLDNAVECHSMGAFAYLTKPLTKKQIVSTIHRAMRWQDVKRAALRMEEILAAEPYSVARDTMQREYVRRMIERCSGDLKASAERSGISLSLIKSLVEDHDAGVN